MSDTEQKHVKDVYEAIAEHFSSTRGAKWKSVVSFLGLQNKGSVGIDFGCGNGKYLDTRPDLLIFGADTCGALLSICGERGFHVLRGDILQSPFRIGVFDFGISVAVIHHMSTVGRREKAVEECLGSLRPGGLFIFTVWALEQPADSKRVFSGQDVLVPWKTGDVVVERYYHVFVEGELEALVGKYGEVIDAGYEKGNWYAVVRRAGGLSSGFHLTCSEDR
ncbi:MAG: tRNA methyltransferase [Amphiamblys sp. WSBS2006]|nr:MAG: tRNA methyltransferase [Amphiamblys sp. WSBS2006]